MDRTDRIEATIGSIPTDWLGALGSAASPERLAPIADYVSRRIDDGSTVLPEPSRVFAALAATPFDTVRAVILGQDPYPTKSQAMGLAFSVPRELPSPLPGSLQNIRKELHSDLDLTLPAHGSLESWTRHGVLLLNTALTVDEGHPFSHRGARWWVLTNAMIRAVASKKRPIAFLLWGRPAQSKARYIDPEHHVIVCSAHPSRRSQSGFLGTKPFSRANQGLRQRGSAEIDWRLGE